MRRSCSTKLVHTFFSILLYFLIDASYSDPLGDAPARPKTAARRNPQPAEDEFGDEELGDDLLPD